MKDREQFIGAHDLGQPAIEGPAMDLGRMPRRHYGPENPNKRGFSAASAASMRVERVQVMRDIYEELGEEVRFLKPNRFR